MLRLIKMCLVAGLALVAGGCAVTNQVVPVKPEITNASSPPAGVGRTLALNVLDSRANPVFGYRDADDPATALTLAPESMRNIEMALAAAYRVQGFNVQPLSRTGDVVITVELMELNYERDTTPTIPNFETKVSFRATSKVGDRTTTANYGESQRKEYPTTPSMGTNAAAVNRVISIALTRMVEDTKLTAP